VKFPSTTTITAGTVCIVPEQAHLQHSAIINHTVLCTGFPRLLESPGFIPKICRT